MQKKTRKCKGSAMLWAVLVMFMVSLMSLGIVMVDRIYYMREQTASYEEQGKLYAQSAVELVADDIIDSRAGIDASGNITTDATQIVDYTYTSDYLSDRNSTDNYTLTFPENSNWTCTLTVNHSAVDMITKNTSKNQTDKGYYTNGLTTGIIYLTAKVSRPGKNGEIELATVCYRLKAKGGKWIADGYYNL